MLFVKDRKHFTNANDQRLAYYSESLTTMFKSMDTYSASNKTKILKL